MKNTMVVALATMILGLAIPVLADAQEAATSDVSMNGTWIRNPRLSDDPMRIIGQRTRPQVGMQNDNRRGGGMKGGGGMRGGGRSSGGMSSGNIPDGIDDAPPGKKRPDLMRGNEHLEIFFEGEEFSVTNAHDIMQTVYTDGRRTERWTELGQVFDTAEVTDGGLVVRSETPDGQSRSVTYILSDTGDRLTVVHAFIPPKSKKAVSMKMVYDRTE